MTELPEGMRPLIRTIHRKGITDPGVLEVMGSIDRRQFVPESFSARAYDDIPLPIECGQTISQPTIVGLMTQELEVTHRHRVLEVGTGTGYQTLILSHLAKRVYSLERHRDLVKSATKTLISDFGRENITTVLSDGSRGLPEAAPFDRIMVCAASEDIPPVLLEQLKVGGIMVLPVTVTKYEQRLMKATKTKDGLECKDLGGVRFVPLVEGVENG